MNLRIVEIVVPQIIRQPPALLGAAPKPKRPKRELQPAKGDQPGKQAILPRITLLQLLQPRQPQPNDFLRTKGIIHTITQS